MAVYSCGDLHGRLDLFQQIKAFLKPEDIVIFLGDANDRGPDGWQLIKTIYEDPQFVYLRGNHEDMLARFLTYCYGGGEWDAEAFEEIISNGGYETLDAAINDDETMIWAQRILTLPTYHFYENEWGEKIFLSHAGFTPFIDEEDESIVLPNDYQLIWDRTHFAEAWPENADNVFVVHGHTPIPLLVKDLYPQHNDIELELGAFWYSSCHKLDIDIGAIWNDCALLVNLDTWDEHLFEVSIEKS